MGAGLPILNVLRTDLIATGDRVKTIEGIFSGTLSYIFNTFEPGMKFSDVIMDAKKKGISLDELRNLLIGDPATPVQHKATADNFAAKAFDAVAIPVYEVPNMGNQAWLLQDGFRGVPWSYYYDNAGGQLLTAVLAAPRWTAQEAMEYRTGGGGLATGAGRKGLNCRQKQAQEAMEYRTGGGGQATGAGQEGRNRRQQQPP